MVPNINPSSQNRNGEVSIRIRFPKPLHKALRRHLVDREPSISINAFTIEAVTEKLDRERVPLL
jgi:hypothetical protein